MPFRFPKKVLSSIGLLAFALAACSRGNSGPVTVSTTRATRQNLTSFISSNGKVEPRESYIIQAQLTAFIDKVLVKQGDMVRRGQILITLDAEDLQGELAKARGDLVTAEDERKTAAGGGSRDELAQLQSDLAKTETEITRLRREGESLERLYTKQAATRQEIEQNKLALEKAEADRRLIEQKRNALVERTKVQGERATLRIQEAQGAIRTVQDKLNAARITAPANGTIYSLTARAGTLVHTGDALAEMADLTRIQVRAFVDEPELGLLKEMQHVEITWDGLPGRVWKGAVEQLPKTIVPRGSRNVGEVLCSVTDSAPELLPNANVGVRIRTAERDNALAIVRNAVRADANKYYVFVVDQGRLRRRDITVGISNSTHYEVLSGITETDVIALPNTTGTGELRDGMPVTAS